MKVRDVFRIKRSVFLGGMLVAAAAVGFFAGYSVRPSVQITNQALRENTDKYNFIHPLLAVSRDNIDIPSPDYVALSRKVGKYIDEQKSTGKLMNASVYYIHYGEKSGSFAFDVEEPYSPASLLKVVIMIAYLKKSDTDSAILNRQIVYGDSFASKINTATFETPSSLIVGKSYTVSELLDSMIAESDNGAMNVLFANIEDSYLSKVYTELGLQGPDEGVPYGISAKDYALFLRVLYNATYLSDASSEKALMTLSRATFDKGLVSGIPEGVTVAHKFGERVNGKGDRIESVELHDCGLVYPANSPYLLCVMTKGDSFKTLESVIGGISKIVYEGSTAQ
jgi:hypothetical protein